MLRKVVCILAVLSASHSQNPDKTANAGRTTGKSGIDTYQTVPGVGRYRLLIEPKTYLDAELECENQEAHLAVPTSKAVEEALVAILRTSNWLLAYIGVNDLEEEGTMVTVQGELWSEVGYTRWEQGEPNDAWGSEDCVILTRNGLLNDWNCSSSLAYFCEKNVPQPAKPTVTPVPGQVNGLDCGLSSSKSQLLVLRGENTRRGEWPWLAAIFLTSGSDSQFRCGGSLISRRFVVTAAHCLVDEFKNPMTSSSLAVHLGRYNLSNTEPNSQIMAVDQIMINPTYISSVKFEYDIGLIVMKTDVVINNFVRTVCLWDDSLNIQLEYLVGKLGRAPGWGTDEHDVTARDMKVVSMPVVSQSQCRESDFRFFNKYISKTTFCAGFRNGSTLCTGDSGGGLYFYQTNPKTGSGAWYVRGIVSLSKRSGYGCGEMNHVLFTDVAKVQSWLKPRLDIKRK